MGAVLKNGSRKSPLSREAIVDAALALAERQGVEKLSVRRVAQDLGVTPMALYKHLESREELLSLTLEAFIVKADVIPAADLPWQEWLDRIGRRMYQALCSDSGWTSIFGTVRVGTEAAQVTDAFVARLTQSGFSTNQALHAYFAVIQTVLGAVCLNSSIQAAGAWEEAEGMQSPVTLAYPQWPTLDRRRMAPELDRLVQMEQIEIALPLVIESFNRLLQRAGSRG